MLGSILPPTTILLVTPGAAQFYLMVKVLQSILDEELFTKMSVQRHINPLPWQWK